MWYMPFGSELHWFVSKSYGILQYLRVAAAYSTISGMGHSLADGCL